MKAHSSTFSFNGLVPSDDHINICHRLAGYDFPWEMNRALELAVLRTFCVPQIAQILRQTGEFIHRPQKRYDDTSLILGNIMKWGYDSPRGRAAIAQMCRIHRRYSIRNEDFLYVLSVLIYEPIRWNRDYGWRLFTVSEKQALFQFWQAVGKRMDIKGIPPTYEAFEQFNRDFEAAHFRYSPDNQVVGDAVVALMTSWLPNLAAPVVPIFVKAIVDDSMREALGWSRPTPTVQRAIKESLRWGRRSVRWLPRRRHSHFVVDTPNLTYPEGYIIEALGPEAVSSQGSSSRCPFLRMQSFFKARA